MTKPRNLALSFALIAGLAVVAACAQEGATPEATVSSQTGKGPEGSAARGAAATQQAVQPGAPNRNAQASRPVGSLGEILGLWDRDQKDRAAADFVAVDWGDAKAFGQIEILRLTESGFVKMPEAARQEVRQECTRFTSTCRALVQHVLGLARQLVASAQYAQAEGRLNAALRFGEALSRGEHLAVLKALGTAAQRAALRDLVELYRKTNDQVKLKTAQERLSKL